MHVFTTTEVENLFSSGSFQNPALSCGSLKAFKSEIHLRNIFKSRSDLQIYINWLFSSHIPQRFRDIASNIYL